MHLAAALILAAMAPLQDGANTWRALPTPALCRASLPALEAPRLARGTHLVVTREDLEAGLSDPVGAALSSAAFAGLLSEESRRENWNVSLHPSVPPLLVRGPPAGLAAAESLCAELDAAARGLEVELQVWLVRGAGSAAPAAKPPGDAPWAATRLNSGGEVLLGERSSHSYLHNYSVEVATDAGVAAPVVGRALTGDVLHARVMRVRGGSAVFVEGLLDLSRLLALEDFELSATDLGSVQQPRVSALQVAFSGSVASGAPLRVSWAGLGEGEALAEGSLWIVPRCVADSGTGRWRVLDTALVEAAAWELPEVDPGGGLLSPQAAGGESGLPQPLASALLVKESEGSSSKFSKSRPMFLWGNGVVLGPRAEADSWAAIGSLHAAYENQRTQTRELEITRAGGFVRLPISHGSRWRVLVCEETTAVIDYDVEIAPETWMPGPRVERRMDGFCVQGGAASDHSSFAAWMASTPAKRVAERSSVPLGRLELPERRWRSARGELRVGQPPVQALGGESVLALALRAP